jgi:hypothetical protein
LLNFVIASAKLPHGVTIARAGVAGKGEIYPYIAARCAELARGQCGQGFSKLREQGWFLGAACRAALGDGTAVVFSRKKEQAAALALGHSAARGEAATLRATHNACR